MYVSYTPAPPKPMGPPSIGATPPTMKPSTTTSTAPVTLRTGVSPLQAYKEGMTDAQIAAFSQCLKERGAAKRAGTYAGHPANDCRALVLGEEPSPTVPPPAPPGPLLVEPTAPARAGIFGLPPWAVYTGAAAVVFFVVRGIAK